jgi:hypothetical protein
MKQRGVYRHHHDFFRRIAAAGPRRIRRSRRPEWPYRLEQYRLDLPIMTGEMRLPAQRKNEMPTAWTKRSSRPSPHRLPKIS